MTQTDKNILKYYNLSILVHINFAFYLLLFICLYRFQSASSSISINLKIFYHPSSIFLHRFFFCHSSVCMNLETLYLSFITGIVFKTFHPLSPSICTYIKGLHLLSSIYIDFKELYHLSFIHIYVYPKCSICYYLCINFRILHPLLFFILYRSKSTSSFTIHPTLYPLSFVCLSEIHLHGSQSLPLSIVHLFA